MIVKAGDGRNGLHLRTVQPAKKQMLNQEKKQEAETLLDQYQTRNRWITRQHQSGNLQEEEMSLARYQAPEVARS